MFLEIHALLNYDCVTVEPHLKFRDARYMTRNDIDASDLAWWYWLSSVKGLGPAYTRSLLDAAGEPKDVFDSTRKDLERSVRLPARTWDELERSKESVTRHQDFAERQVKMAAAMEARILTLNDPEYPEFLKSQPKQAPAIIHVQGDLSLVRPKAVAVVGTRSASSEAMDRVRAFCGHLAQGGYPVIAGMARGVDTAAHRGAVDSTGITVGVLGSGLDHTYPPENAPLYVEARKRGLLISQFPFGSAPNPSNLRQRNKLIVALAEAVVIAESDVQGGAMIAARNALEQRKRLFAFQFPQMDASTRAGTQRLLETRLARSADDGDIESLFTSPVFVASGANPSKVWREAFPSEKRGNGGSGQRRSERRGGSAKRSGRSRRRPAPASPSTTD